VKSSLRCEPDVPGDLLRAIFGNVTEPRHAHWFRSRGRLGGLVICCGAMLQHVSSSLRLPLCRLHAESRKNAGTGIVTSLAVTDLQP
jgi:hypothetical protein